MRKLILIVQTSFDGFVAGPNGSFDNFIGGEENLGFVCTLIDDGDAILMGRASYELLNSNWPTAAVSPGATENMIKYSNWYNSVPKIVLSKTLNSDNLKNTVVISNNIEKEINQLKQQEGKNILMFGSPTAFRALLEQNLIDGIWLIFHPVIFGQGISLFKDGKNTTHLTLISTKALSNGTLCLQYSVNTQAGN